MTSSQLSSQFPSQMIGFNNDITSGIAPGTLTCARDLPKKVPMMRGQMRVSRQDITSKKKSNMFAQDEQSSK